MRKNLVRCICSSGGEGCEAFTLCLQNLKECSLVVYVREEGKAWTILRSRLSVVNGVAADEGRPTSVGHPPGHM